MPPLQILCAGAVKAPFSQAVAAFERSSGRAVACTFGAVGTLARMIEAGAPADLVVLNREATASLQARGMVSTRSFSVGSVGVGLAVRSGHTLGDVPDVHRLREVLLQAPSLAYGDPAHGDSSGVHFRGVLQKLGIVDQVAGKTRLADSGLHVVQLVHEGAVAIGATQSSVVLGAQGVALAALLPTELQKTTEYVCALVAPGTAPEGAADLWRHLQQPEVTSAFRQAGFA